METFVFIIIVLVAFIGAVAIANSSRNGFDNSELKDEEKTPCTMDDYTYELKTRK